MYFTPTMFPEAPAPGWVDALLATCRDLAAGKQVLPVEAWMVKALEGLPEVLEALALVTARVVPDEETSLGHALRSPQLRGLQASALRTLARLVLGREARPDELIAWQAGLDAGEGMRQLRDQLHQSAEARLARVFRRVTGRFIGQAERQHWLACLAEGMEMLAVEAAIRERHRAKRRTA